MVIAVTDYERSTAFYREVLGAEVIDLTYGCIGYRLPGDAQLNVHGPGNTASPRAVDPVRPGQQRHLPAVGRHGGGGAGASRQSTASRSSKARPSASAREGSALRCTSGIPMGASWSSSLTAELAAARIGATYNQYADSELRRERLLAHLERNAPTILVGEAAGYRGARVSGIAFTSERQLTGAGPAEASATIVHRVLRELGIEDEVLLWNVVPTHPGTERSNRRPTRAEVEASHRFLLEVTRDRRVVAVGRLAADVLEAPYVRHPAYGGAGHSRRAEGRLGRLSATIRPRRGSSRAVLMTTYNAKPGEIARDWYVVDAEGKTLGRLATQIADTLRGKRKPQYTPHVDTGDFVVVVNAEKIAVTGNKLDQKRYYRHSGYPGGLRSRTLREQLDRRPTEVLRVAVRGMLPRNRLARQQLTKLKVYAGPEHPHGPQNPKPLEVEQ